LYICFREQKYNLSSQYQMPICHREITENQTEFLIWKITETEAELRQGLTLSPAALARLAQRKSSVHRKDYLAIRQLLKLLKIPPLMHQYNSEGVPYLTDGRYISISHTRDLASVVISSRPVGIDLEYYKEKIRRIAPRFLHPTENEIPQGEAGLGFNTQLRIDPFVPEATAGKGWVIEGEQQTSFALQFRIFENYCLTLAT
jgi:4'-phosphopantetheinyl transferase EntD